MRRFFLFATLFLAFSAMASAVPALPGTFTYTQPDGTVIRLRVHGDEYYHWTTDEAGNTVEMDHVGYYRRVQRDHRFGIRRAQAQRAQANERRRGQYDPVLTNGERHIPVVLVDFKNLSFVIPNPQQAFDRLLNQQDYADNGSHGSVRDYYTDNSSGAFTPVFDVFPPVPLSQDYATYDGNERQALIEACKELDATVDFSQYDWNHDGYVDMILFYYAGYNQAEGGPEDTIWPHQGGVYTDDLFDGLRLGTYFCTSELRFNASFGPKMCGIGTTCHEFAHSLGLPDFYDTNYEEDGSCTALSDYSPMCGGSYNDNSTRPACFTALERDMLGWLSGEGLVEITNPGSYTVPALQQNKAYFTATATEGEYFIYECRAGLKWDAPLAKGLVIYHVDQSQRLVNGIRATDLWRNTNSINSYGPHPCYTLVPSADPTLLSFDNFSLSKMVYPGSRNVTSFTPVDWEGLDTGIDISGISFSGSQVTMNVSLRSLKGLEGKVLNTAGAPLQGALVRVGSFSSSTNASGAYSLSLTSLPDGPVQVEVSCSGYQSVQVELELGRFLYHQDFTLMRNGETPLETIQKFTTPYSGGSIGIGTTTLSAATYFSQEDLLPYVGKRLMSIDFVFTPASADAVYVIVEKGPNGSTTSLLKCPVINPEKGWNHVDVSDQGLYIPADTDLFIGYHIINASDQWAVSYESVPAGTGSGCLKISDYPQYWFLYDDFNTYVSATLKEDEAPEENWLFPWIDNPGDGHYKAGSVFPLVLHQGAETPKTVKWYFDGELVSDSSVTLAAGTHQLEARLGYQDASVEHVYLLLTAE